MFRHTCAIFWLGALFTIFVLVPYVLANSEEKSSRLKTVAPSINPFVEIVTFF